jgi:hypothetical protein
LVQGAVAAFGVVELEAYRARPALNWPGVSWAVRYTFVRDAAPQPLDENVAHPAAFAVDAGRDIMRFEHAGEFL